MFSYEISVPLSDFDAGKGWRISGVLQHISDIAHISGVLQTLLTTDPGVLQTLLTTDPGVLQTLRTTDPG
ncbi:hypothetical protein DPMN_107703 [Dreissena polymorpha]|uniref:Uncharacterized protein n=1 Tax=Dreissena polymorpha TaxID=45954 RepID=A0A9D4K769_DREPO|nr:hypothetical protein DPMN_107703 [Dreissena polymorpha]